LVVLAAAAIAWCLWSPASRLAADPETSTPAAAADSPSEPANETPAQASSSDSAAGSNPAETLRIAREKLSGPGIRSIRARLVERVTIGDRSFKAEGTYLQGADFKIRLEFTVSIGSGKAKAEGSLLEVCDGTILWTRHAIGKQPRITRRDVRQILNAARSNNAETILTVELGLGGLPALLASLEKSMVFTVQRDEQINGKQFTMIEGRWNDQYLERYRKISKSDHLPDHIPDAVRIYLEPEVLFPRRIAYLKRAPKRDELRNMVELDLVDIVLNAPVDDHEFDFVPPDGAFTVDITNAYLQQLNAMGGGTPESSAVQPAGGESPPQ